MTASIENCFLTTIREKKLTVPGEKILLAVSGGADSVAMLYLFHRLKKILGIKLSVVHFNHGLRGAESDRDQDFVKNLSKKLGLPADFGHGNVKKFAQRKKLSLEAAARELRYAFLKKTAQKRGATKIATAHTADDQTETFFMRLIRGSTAAGLAGILFERKDKIIRPMLEISRCQIEEFLKKNKIKFRQDSSNFKMDFLRNRLRRQIIPLLEKINPNLKETVSRNTRLIQEEEKWLENLVQKAYGAVVLKDGLKTGEKIKTNLNCFKKIPGPLARRVIKKILKINIGEKEISSRNIEDILEKITARPVLKNWQLHLPGPTFVYPEGNYLVFSPKPPGAQIPGRQTPTGAVSKEYCYRLIPGKKFYLAEAGQTGRIISAEIVKKVPPLKIMKKSAPAVLYLDAFSPEPLLFIRSRRPGDRFQPLGQKKPKKLKDFLIDKKIPQSEKDAYPVLTDRRGQILAVLGLGISENCKITKTTKKVIKIRIV